MEINYIQVALKETRVEAETLHGEDAEGIRTRLEIQFTAQSGSAPLWERLIEPMARHCRDGWLKACEFVDHRVVVLFFDKAEGSTMWRFRSGADLACVLRECPALEFYLTDMNASFVLCHNHHDYLIGVGSCKPWLEGVRDE